MPLTSQPKARYQPTESPSPTLPKGRELILAVFEAVECGSFPLWKVGMGLLSRTERTPGNSVGVAAACGRPIAGSIHYYLLM